MTLSHHFSNRAEQLKPNAIRSIGRRASAPGMIRFTAGNPSPTILPAEAMKPFLAQVVDKYGPDALQYGMTEGFTPLRELIASRTPHTNPEDVLLISGSQQAIDLTCKLFLDPGDKVAVAAPTYTGALSTFRVYGAEFLNVACDYEGMLPDSLEAALQQGPKLIYCIPNFMNPTGVDMSRERRQAVVDLARQYNVPILEDDPYGELRFVGSPQPTLYELAPEQVIYGGSYSKILAPGLRLGWLLAKEELMFPLVNAKQTSDLQSPTFTQMLVYEVMASGFLAEQIDRLRRFYHQQRSHLLEAMDQHLPEAVRYQAPAGGFFVWCELPAGMDAGVLVDEALAAGVAYVPGRPFFASDQGQNTLRLSYSSVPTVEMEEGIMRLAAVLRQHL
ncbi:MAG: PLP-dependent aminotransferase family protein [Ardenticatenaceae bacterium]|nr:PLP-dependent aminotransferase family protein [Ardenticatenaceae bacterium]